jgi:tetratricopeptide (TPR) repeat protein
MPHYDEDDFDDFMTRVNDVDATIKALASGDIHPNEVDDAEARAQEEQERRRRKKQEKIAVEEAKLQAKRDEEAKKQEYIEDHYDELKEKVDAIKADRVMKEAARKRFGSWRQKHSKTLVTDYKGWDIWEPEEDEDDNIYKDCPPPDSPELRALEADIVERGRKKRAREKLAEQEKENGNRAFKAQQFSEALRCYDIAVENNKCHRQYLNNRAFAHIKLRGWASAIEDCDKSLYVGEAFEGIGDRRPPDTTTAKSYLRRALAHAGRGDLAAAVADFERTVEICPKDESIKKQLRRARAELAEQEKEAAVRAEALAQQEASTDGGAGEGSGAFGAIQSCVEQLGSCAADESPQLLKQLEASLAAGGDEQRVFARTAGAVGLVCSQLYTPAAGAALGALYQLALNRRNLEEAVSRRGLLSHLTDLADASQADSLREGALAVLAEGSRHERCRETIQSEGLGTTMVGACVHALTPGRGSGSEGGAGSVGAAPTTQGALSALEQQHAQQNYAATALGNLATEIWFRQLLEGQAEPLLDALLVQCLSPHVDVAHKSASALTNLASDAAWRARLGVAERLGVLLKVLQINLHSVGRASAHTLADVIQNGLGVLANCALEPAVQQLLVSELKALPVLVALLTPSGVGNAEAATGIVTRATMVLGRCMQQPGAAELCVSLGALPKVLARVGPAVTALEEAAAAASSAADDDDQARQQELGLLEAAARLLAGCAMKAAGAGAAVVEAKGGLAAAVAMLGVSHGTVAANTALGIAHIGKDEAALPALGAAGAVPALIKVAHRSELEKARQNAGIALARLAKHPPNLEQLRELHGIEIIHHYVRPANMKK